MEKLLGMIGLAKRAGYVSVGGFACESAVKSRTSKLIILAADASHNTKKTIIDSCAYYNIPFLEFSDMKNLGKFTGGGEKAVISINDRNFADSIKKKFDGIQRKDR